MLAPFGASTLAIALAVTVASCSASRTQGGLDPRYVAVHNTMTATGLVQVGPIQRGSLAEGREARLRLDLSARCTTVVALGGAGVRDIELALLDSEGRPVAREVTHDPEAAIRACPERAGPFTLIVRMAGGSGDWIAGTWAGEIGGDGRVGAVPSAGAATEGSGTCDAPHPLVAGVVAGTTRRGEAEHAGSCVSSTGSELVYVFDVTRRQRVMLEVESAFDAVLYLRREDCADEAAEIACNDDSDGGASSAGTRRTARLDEVLDPGRYFVFVDGYGSEEGTFKLTMQASDVPAVAEICQRRPVLALGTTSGRLDGATDGMHATCGDQAKGPDSSHRLDVPTRSRVRISLASPPSPAAPATSGFSPIVHVRRQCDDERSEIACSSSSVAPQTAAVVTTLDAGSYTVVADAMEKDARGRYTLDAELAPEHGSGVTGDACGDALPLALSEKRIEGDTFLARDDASGTCAGQGAPDVVYRFELARRSRVSARFLGQEGAHVFVLQRSCGDSKTELACSADVDEVLPPGVYGLVVDGSAKEGLGRYAFAFQARDVTGQEAACRTVPLLVPGQKVNGSTAGSGDHFLTSCGSRDDASGSSDRVYRIEIAKRTHVKLRLTTPSFDGVLALRSSCLDAPRARPPRGAELSCHSGRNDGRLSKIDSTLEAGTYYVVVDGYLARNEGPFTLQYDVVR